MLAIEPIDAVDARWLSLFPQQDEQPPISKPAALVGEIAQTGAQLNVRRPVRAVADHLAISGNEDAGPTLAHLQGVTQMSDSLALGGGPYHFFVRSSFSAA